MAGVREARGRSKTQRKAGTEKEGGTLRIEGVEDEQRTAPEEVTSKDGDREAEQEAEEEGSTCGTRSTIRKYDPRQPTNRK